VSLWKIQYDPIYGCHIWAGEFGNHGRPIVWRGQTPFGAHIAAYEQSFGKVKDEMVLDHTCRRTSCVNPDHLEPVSRSENEKRKSMAYRIKRKKCIKGHVLNEVTRLTTPEGGVLCRTCRYESVR
jgi:HNH endonuclease